MISHPFVKINLGLNVLRKREDGFHDIETVFFPFKGIYDTLEIVSGEDYSTTSFGLLERYAPEEISQAITPDGSVMVTIARRGGIGWDPLTDITVKACTLVRESCKIPPVKIFLEKTSPVGAGLGGGSADGAFALRMLSDMFSLGLSREQLIEMASRLGSDCAFFIDAVPSFACGRGEILTPLPENLARKLSSLDIRVRIPEGISVRTAEAYGGIVPRLPQVRITEVLKRPVEEWKDLLVNDFEETVFAAHPRLAELKKEIYAEGARYVSMSGSGSAFFAIF